VNPNGIEPLVAALTLSLGQAAFVAVYVLVLAGIIWLPKALRDRSTLPVPWWKNLRLWAALICGIQILVYGLLA
jgi:hypothetical protein